MAKAETKAIDEKVSALETALAGMLEQQHAQGELLRSLVAKMCDTQVATVDALKTLGKTVQVKSRRELAHEAAAAIDQQISHGERRLFDAGPLKFRVGLPFEKRMTRVVGAADALHADRDYRRHFGILRTAEGNDPLVEPIEDLQAAELEYVDLCQRMNITPLDAQCKPIGS
jgi:hypothetical protein